MNRTWIPKFSKPMAIKKVDHFVALLKKHINLYLGLSIAVFLFILFFQPFSTDRFVFENKLLFVAGFGIIIFLFLLITQIGFQKLFTQDEDEISENLFLRTIYNFTLIASTVLAFVFYIRYVGQDEISFYTVLKVIIICFIAPIVLYMQNMARSDRVKYRKLLHESRLMQNKLKQFSENYSNKYIELVSENDSDNFQVLVSEIVFLKSADNYVEVGYKENDEIKKRLVRNTLKKIEQQLKEYNNFIRTHRTSIVNIQFVEKLNKNFNTYWLSLSETKEIIPVARQYLMVLKDLL
jgi:hypothetical protein